MQVNGIVEGVWLFWDRDYERPGECRESKIEQGGGGRS